MSSEQPREKTVNEGCPSADKDTPVTHARSRGVRRQLMTLAKVYEQADAYYRAALRPVIKTVMAHNAEER